ncbi:MAG: YqgE/AlgH family protein [Sodaliphilus sp.]
MGILDEDIFNLKEEQPRPSQGDVLLAKPMVDDMYFKRAVVLLTAHDHEGSLGFIMNLKSEYSLADLGKEWELYTDVPLYVGGPVGLDTFTFVHTLGPSEIRNAVELIPGLYLGGEFEDMKRYVFCGEATEGKVKFLVGYSGWEAGQLNQELGLHDWLIAKDTDIALLMSDTEEPMWQMALERFGDKYRLWNNWPLELHDN